ncbi:transcription termination factor MTEF18, mitochondrial [Fagus crenata]
MVLNQTKDVIEKKIDCLRNYLACPLESVVAFPAYLCYDMERISPRFSTYVWLRERGAAKPTLSLSTLLACSDARFVRYFVDVHPEGPAMWEKIKNHSPSS